MILPFLLNIEHCWPTISQCPILRKMDTPMMVRSSRSSCFPPCNLNDVSLWTMLVLS